MKIIIIPMILFFLMIFLAIILGTSYEIIWKSNAMKQICIDNGYEDFINIENIMGCIIDDKITGYIFKCDQAFPDTWNVKCKLLEIDD